MKANRMRIAMLSAIALLAFGAVASPVAAAGSPQIYTFGDTWTVQHGCGVVETTTMTAKARDYFDQNGSWLRSVINFDYAAVFTGPSGKSFASESHQTGTFTPTTGSLSGQGIFLRAGGKPILMDVGRLVFTLPDGTVVKDSDKALDFGAGDIVDAALCAELGA